MHSGDGEEFSHTIVWKGVWSLKDWEPLVYNNYVVGVKLKVKLNDVHAAAVVHWRLIVRSFSSLILLAKEVGDGVKGEGAVLTETQHRRTRKTLRRTTIYRRRNNNYNQVWAVIEIYFITRGVENKFSNPISSYWCLFFAYKCIFSEMNIFHKTKFEQKIGISNCTALKPKIWNVGTLINLYFDYPFIIR